MYSSSSSYLLPGMAASEEAAPALSAKDAKAQEKAARKIELALKKEARLIKKKGEKEGAEGTEGTEGGDKGVGDEGDNVEEDKLDVEKSIDDLKI